MPDRRAARAQTFHLILIKPSHYDDDGYVIQWFRSAVPSNTLATLYGLALDCARRRVLGAEVEIRITAIDETNTRVRPDRIARQLRRTGGLGLVALVGVQSNQYPRAMDIARPLRAAGVPVAIGGFHVSGTIAMLPGLQPEVQEAVDLGMAVFAGEAEERLEELLKDAFAGRLQPVYDTLAALPNLAGVPVPGLPRSRVRRVAGSLATFDAGRGCPFTCSFCTIINVQGRKSRRRSPDDVERIIRANLAQGITRFFITDDNFARNKNWEAILDRLISLREQNGLRFRLVIQVDTLCHRLPQFIDKAARAGVSRVFIGLETINPGSLAAAGKHQNRIGEYRLMLQAWKRAGVFTACGYIVGFPQDTPESVIRDIETIQEELPVDLLEFFCLTPLPGSEDHKTLWEQGVWMDPDLNKYDSCHVVTGHPTMNREAWEQLYRRAWETYFSAAHIERVMRRAAAFGLSTGKALFPLLWFRVCFAIENVPPLEGGFFRLKFRRDRRPGLPVESRWRFYPRYGWEVLCKHVAVFRLWRQFAPIRRRIKADPNRRSYTDRALAPVRSHPAEALALSTRSGAPAAVASEPSPSLGHPAAAAES